MRRMTEQHRNNLRLAQTGKKHSRETRNKMKIAWKTREPMSQSTRAKISKRQTGKTVSEETRQKMREAKFKNPSKVFKDTLIERLVAKELTNLGLEFEQQYPLFKAARVDFYLPTLNVAIQCDGCYWHGCPEHFPGKYPAAAERAIAQDFALASNGVRVVRMWEHEIHASVSDSVQRVWRMI